MKIFFHHNVVPNHGGEINMEYNVNKIQWAVTKKIITYCDKRYKSLLLQSTELDVSI